MADELQDLREKYLSYLQPEQFFDIGVREQPSRINGSKERMSKFDKLQTKNCNEGKQYISKSGKVTQGKSMTFQSCNCPLQCWKKFTEQKMENLFKEFWEMGSLERRREFVARFCAITKKGMRNSFSYSLPNDDAYVKVCRQFFCNILDVTFRFISWTLCNKLSTCKTHVNSPSSIASSITNKQNSPALPTLPGIVNLQCWISSGNAGYLQEMLDTFRQCWMHCWMIFYFIRVLCYMRKMLESTAG